MEQIDELTDEEISLLCCSDDDMEARERGESGYRAFNYQEKFLECWEMQGLKLEQIRQKWEMDRGKWPVPDQPWNKEIEDRYLRKQQRERQNVFAYPE